MGKTLFYENETSFNMFVICVDDYVYVLIGVFYNHFYETIQFLSYYSFYSFFTILERLSYTDAFVFHFSKGTANKI